MYRFRNIDGLTRMATIMLWVHMVPQLWVGAYLFYHSRPAGQHDAPTATAWMDQLMLLPLIWAIATVIVMGCWIYRASANAHALAGNLTVRPGWAVGWYFIPIAHLFKPFDAMKEIWLASHDPRNWQGHAAPLRLLVWWGLWVVTLCLHNMAGYVADRNWALAAKLGLTEGVLNVPLCLLLINIVRNVASAQDRAALTFRPAEQDASGAA
ncbi:DUF4328 domain-containing protein [Sphingomonas sp.]|uniref:DUF4328 domain-containing protein n=1 Tax=Sphingomonas sp. TaxID=28214 RepID=UPI003B3B5C17